MMTMTRRLMTPGSGGFLKARRREVARVSMVLLCAGVLAACAHTQPNVPSDRNALSQETGEAGSTIRSEKRTHPNTAGNIVAPPGNPAGNPAGAPPIVGGTTNQRPRWPDNR
jgi:hypothetical protein